MSHTRTFPKCQVCGTYGHRELLCPVGALNREQEAAARATGASLAPISLGLTPALEAEIAKIREAWRVRA
jgi:hypothetical protein